MKNLISVFKDAFYSKYRHVKRGSDYIAVVDAELQDDSGKGVKEGAILKIYIQEDGKAWAREISEFHDGRFNSVGIVPLRSPTVNPIYEVYRLLEALLDTSKYQNLPNVVIEDIPNVVRLYYFFKESPAKSLNLVSHARIYSPTSFEEESTGHSLDRALEETTKLWYFFKEFANNFEAIPNVSDN